MHIVAFAVLFIVTAILTAAEMATFSARPERMRQVAEAGDRRGRLVLAFQRSPVSFLAAGQVIATFGSLAIGAIMQAQVVPMLSRWIGSPFELTQRQVDGIAAFVALTFFTVIALILTNVVPKQIGFDHADEIAIRCSRPMRLLIRLTRPIAWIVTVTSQVFERAVNRQVKRGSRVTEADLLTLVAEGIRIGALDERETAFVKNALRLSDISVRQEMTPWHAVEAVDAAWPMSKIDEAVRRSTHAYIPVYRLDSDRTVGVLRARDWLASASVPSAIDPYLDPPVVVRADGSTITVFEALKGADTRIVFVQDEHGATCGILSLNDAVRLLAGEMKSLDA